MKRQVYLLPTSTYELTSDGVACSGCVDPGSSPYWWVNTPSKAAWEALQSDDGPKVNATPTSSYVHFHGDGTSRVLCGFEPPPTLVLIEKLTIEAKWDYSHGGSNYQAWWFPPDNAFGPKAALALLGRTGTSQYGTPFEVPGDGTYHTNINQPLAQAGDQRLMTWGMTAHPEGGPWTMEDVRELKAGIRIYLSNGPNGRPFDPSGAKFFKVRVSWLRITLDVEDLGGYVDPARHDSSLTLRMMRRARNVVRPAVRFDRAVGEVGDRVYMSHPRGPAIATDGWGPRRLERGPGIIVKRTIHPEPFSVEDECFYTQSYACLGWATYRIDLPWSPELQGMALLAKGNAFTHQRAQDGWSPRPGDAVLMRVIEDYPNLSFHGLAAQGGGDEAICLRNYDLMQGGWSTVGESGVFTAAIDDSVTMVEEQGYQSSAKLTYSTGQGGRSRSLGTLPYNSGDFVHVRVVVKNTTVATPGTDTLEWGLSRSGGGLPATEYWNEAGRAWTTTPTYNEIPSDDAYGESIADAIPCDAGAASSDPTYTIQVGQFTSDLTDCVFHTALVDVQHTDSTVAGARTPLVTLDAEITRISDKHTLANSAAAELWSYERGVAVAEVCPFWRAEDLPADAVKPIIHARHAGDTWDALQFIPKTGTDDLVRFERAVSGQATFQLDVAIAGLDITRAHVLRAWARWLGADGWHEYGPYSVEVGYAVLLESDGSLVQSDSTVGALSYTGAMTDRDWLGIGLDGQPRFLDGWVRMWETRRNPIDGLEAIWRI